MWWTEEFLRVCWDRMSVRVNLTWKTRRGLVIDWGDVMSRTQRRGKAVGRAVVPVQMSVHWGERVMGEDDIQTVYNPGSTFIFPELQHRVQTK